MQSSNSEHDKKAQQDRTFDTARDAGVVGRAAWREERKRGNNPDLNQPFQRADSGHEFSAPAMGVAACRNGTDQGGVSCPQALLSA
jgi:hypothetical protein